MKKLLILCLILSIVGCDDNQPISDYEELRTNNPTRVEEFTFRGHNYLVITQYRTESTIHDPDCSKCKANESIPSRL